MQSRADVARFIELQLTKPDSCDRKKNYRHHYGRQELRELMDFIYGGEPQSDDEEIKSDNKEPILYPY